MDSVIKNTNELEFAIFCIENLAKRFHTDGKMMYNLLAEQSDILNDYIIELVNICFVCIFNFI